MFKKARMFLHYNRMFKRAKSLYQNRSDLMSVIDDVKGKLNKDYVQAAIETVSDQLRALVRLVDAYRKGEYSDIERKSVVAIIAAILYFISPIDAIPDLLAGIGLIDDVAVIGYVANAFHYELNKFLKWESMNRTDVEADKPSVIKIK